MHTHASQPLVRNKLNIEEMTLPRGGIEPWMNKWKDRTHTTMPNSTIRSNPTNRQICVCIWLRGTSSRINQLFNFLHIILHIAISMSILLYLVYIFYDLSVHILSWNLLLIDWTHGKEFLLGRCSLHILDSYLFP